VLLLADLVLQFIRGIRGHVLSGLGGFLERVARGVASGTQCLASALRHVRTGIGHLILQALG
jgi:hypothetical protein